MTRRLLLRLMISAVVLGICASAHAAPRADQAGDVAFNRQWAEALFADRPGQISAANRVTIAHDDGPPGTKVGLASVGTAMRLGEKTYTRGIGVNSHNVLHVSLHRPAARLLAEIGVDRGMDSTVASVRFHVAVGGRDVFCTEVMRERAHRAIDVPLSGAREFDLIVDNGGDDRTCDQADWADARVVTQDGSVLWLDELASTPRFPSAPPFSFVYGGKPSSELFSTWRSRVTDRLLDPSTRLRTLTLTDPETGLEVKAEAKVYLDTAGTDWTLYLTNTGSQDTPIIEQLRAVDVGVQVIGGEKTLHLLHGSKGLSGFTFDDFQPYDEPMPLEKRIEIGVTDALSSYDVSPFFNLDWGSGGVITAVGWTGNWGATVEHASDGSLRLSAGMKNLRLRLHPGETIRSPRILQVYYSGKDEWRPYNLFRRTMLKHIMPQSNGTAMPLPFTYAATVTHDFNKTTEAIQRSYIDAAKGLGFDCYWLDAYWIKGGYPTGIGEWGFPVERVPDPIRFPKGMKPVGDALAKAGIKFMLWMGVESVFANTYLANEHPEWVICLPTADDKSIHRKGAPGTLNLADPAAREFMTRYLRGAIKEYGIGAWFTDSGPALGHWRLADDGPDRVGITEIRYVEGFYRLWDDFLKAGPDMLIGNCCGGGTRIDLETCARSLSIWRTDAAQFTINGWHDAEKASIQNQILNTGLNRYIPFAGGGQIGPDPYHFRSGFNGGITFCDDIRGKDYPREMLRQALAEGRRIRKYWYGDFYPLHAVSPSPSDWNAVQYHRPTEQDGCILAFRRSQSPFFGFTCDLHGIDPKSSYEVTTYITYKPSKAKVMTGTQLQHLRVDIKEHPGSVLVEYRRVGARR